MKQTKYMREDTKGKCTMCPRENVDVVRPMLGTLGGAGPTTVGLEPMRWAPGQPVIARHLARIEEYGPRGALPGGFCLGSLGPIAERPAKPEGRAKRKR